MKIEHIILIALIAAVESVGARSMSNDGYPLSNFSLTVNASLDGNIAGEALINPGRLGAWLSSVGGFEFSVEKGGRSHPLSAFERKHIVRRFPFVRNEYGQSDVISSSISITAFCPLRVNDIKTSSLPTLLLEMTITATQAEKFNIVLNADTVGEVKPLPKKRYYATTGRGATVSDVKLHRKDNAIAATVSMKKGETKVIRLAIEYREDEQVYTQWFTKLSDAGVYALDNWDALYTSTLQFSEAIPATGDEELDTYLRWYMTPGIALTKCTKNNEVLTMGYCELNQRDSYWTTWLHLVLFRDLERKMLLESIEYQQPSGKIPTTVLPLIERHDDLDINAFFILREARYYRMYQELAELKSDWAALRRAMDWLISRDKSGNGLPEQVSFWGDWKDVQGVKDRRYSPFSGLIYLAALKEMQYLGKAVSDGEAVEKYAQAYDKGYEFINRSVDDGGLWNGSFYCQRWKDGTVNTHLLQDQTIGILFGVVPSDRSGKILDVLNSQSLTPYGIAETTPYYPESFGYKPATYHNGAVWPWLSFMDCWARAKTGREAEAISLVKKVAHADLVASGDWSPNEHINSLTGENLGFRLQGWNAGLYGFVYFGLLHKDLNIIPK